MRNRRGRGRGVLAAFLLAALVSGCDSFFEVDLPGRLVAEDLNDPALAENLALAVQGDLECGFRGYLFNDVLWSGVGTYLGAYREWFLTEQRSIGKQDGGNGDCTHIRRPAWLPMHIVRNQADVAIELIGGFADGDVGDRDYLMAKAYVYGGYATEFLAEHYCSVVFGGDGVERSREEGFEAAAELFTSGLELARGASHSDAGRLRNLALVGRARARLNMGDGTGAVADAQQVENGFVGYLDYQLGDPRREWWVSANDFPVNISIRSHYRNLTVEGLVGGEPVVMDDPRVPLEFLGLDRPGLEHWNQTKYPNEGVDIPFATWREAQLVIAEVLGGQEAVAIINNLRATVSELGWVSDDHPGLPPFRSTDEDEIRAQVIEERRRELFLQGTTIGDDIRTGEWRNWPGGTTAGGLPIDTSASCLPVPIVELR